MILESDRWEVWRYGQLQKGAQGIGLVLVKVRDGGSSPQEMSYAPLERVATTLGPVIAWVQRLTAGADGLCVYLNRGADWRLLFMAPDLTTVDVFETFSQQVEERANHEQRKTKSRRRARRTE